MKRQFFTVLFAEFIRSGHSEPRQISGSLSLFTIYEVKKGMTKLCTCLIGLYFEYKLKKG